MQQQDSLQMKSISALFCHANNHWVVLFLNVYLWCKPKWKNQCPSTEGASVSLCNRSKGAALVPSLSQPCRSCKARKTHSQECQSKEETFLTILHQDRGYKAFNKQFLRSSHRFRKPSRISIGLFYQKAKSKYKNPDTTKIHWICYIYFFNLWFLWLTLTSYNRIILPQSTEIIHKILEILRRVEIKFFRIFHSKQICPKNFAFGA